MWILAGFGDQGREKWYLEKNMRREREREREREKTKKSKKPRKLIFFHYAKNGLEFNDEGERKNILNQTS